LQTVYERRRRRVRLIALSFATSTLVVMVAAFLAWRFQILAI
jgi:hypothetical protein